MAYSIKVHDDFVKELAKLDFSVKQQLRKKLDKVIENPHIPKNRLHGDLHNCYKIKLNKAGIRLVYQVMMKKFTFYYSLLGVELIMRSMTKP